MKKSLFLLLIPILAACSAGVKKDLATGLSASYKGFAIDDAFLAAGDGNKLANNKVVLGSKIMIVVTGVSNYTLKDNLAYPGCMIELTDKTGTKILELADAFAEKEGSLPEKVKTLEAFLTTGDPMKAGETYHLKARFFDKNNSESEIMTEVDFQLQ